jgi:hypothetical protein
LEGSWRPWRGSPFLGGHRGALLFLVIERLLEVIEVFPFLVIERLLEVIERFSLPVVSKKNRTSLCPRRSLFMTSKKGRSSQ